MTKLKDQPCEACRPDAPKLDDEQIRALMPHVPSWQVIEVDGVKRLMRCYTFKNFADALLFTNKVGEAAESVGHHPDLLTQWGKVTITWWTHKINGLHRSDFIMAARSDDLYGSM
ncbi:4a-hydroxytetrahydrobiopterin dehydratase [Pseudomonadota bacterium]